MSKLKCVEPSTSFHKNCDICHKILTNSNRGQIKCVYMNPVKIAKDRYINYCSDQSSCQSSASYSYIQDMIKQKSLVIEGFFQDLEFEVMRSNGYIENNWKFKYFILINDV